MGSTKSPGRCRRLRAGKGLTLSVDRTACPERRRACHVAGGLAILRPSSWWLVRDDRGLVGEDLGAVGRVAVVGCDVDSEVVAVRGHRERVVGRDAAGGGPLLERDLVQDLLLVMSMSAIPPRSYVAHAPPAVGGGAGWSRRQTALPRPRRTDRPGSPEVGRDCPKLLCCRPTPVPLNEPSRAQVVPTSRFRRLSIRMLPMWSGTWNCLMASKLAASTR